METPLTIALIIIRPGPLRSSLQTLITSMPQIQLVAESKDVSALLQLRSQLQPGLVVMEAGQPTSDVCAALSEIRAVWPSTQTIVLVENAAQQQAVEAVGADAVLYQGFRAARFISVIEDLLFARARAGADDGQPRSENTESEWSGRTSR